SHSVHTQWGLERQPRAPSVLTAEWTGQHAPFRWQTGKVMSRLAIAARFGRRPLLVAASALLGLAFVSSAMAQEATTEDQLADIVGAVDTLWLLLAAFMVFLMQAGFALVEAGFVRAKNTSNILMKNVLDCCIGGLLFWAVGWGIAYGVSGEASNGFIGD